MAIPYCLYVLEYKNPPNKKVLYYVGITWNPLQRWKQHIEGTGATTTLTYGVKQVVYTKWYKNRKEAEQAEDIMWGKVKKGEELPTARCNYPTPKEIISMYHQELRTQKLFYPALG